MNHDLIQDSSFFCVCACATTTPHTIVIVIRIYLLQKSTKRLRKAAARFILSGTHPLPMLTFKLFCFIIIFLAYQGLVSFLSGFSVQEESWR